MPFKRAITYSLIINLFFLALCLIFGDLKFGAVDDYFMAARLTGALGTEYNPHLIFVNAIYGYMLLPLYHLFPKIGWYYIGEMFAVFISLTTIGYVLLQKCGDRWGIILATLFTALFASDFYLVVQFTQCASILSASGMLLFAYGIITYANNTSMDSIPRNKSGAKGIKWLRNLIKLQDDKLISTNNSVTLEGLSPDRVHHNFFSHLQKATPFIFAIILMLWGSVMRWQAFLMGMPFFCLGLLFIIKQCWQTKYHVIVGLAILFVGASAMHNFDQNIYKAPEYETFNKFQGPRVSLGDNGNYNQNAVLEDIEELGLSGKDYNMLTEWIHYDTEVFSVDSLKRYTDIIPPYRNTNVPEFIPHNLINALGKALHSPLFWTWFILCIIVYLTNPKKFLYLWASLFIVLALMAHLLAISRLVYRVESGFWLYASVLAIPLFGKFTRNIPNKLVYIVLGIIATANIFSYATSGNMIRNPNTGTLRTITVEDTTDYAQVFNYIDNQPDKIFLLNMKAFMLFSHHRNPPYIASPVGSYRRTISFGYWTPYLPEVIEALTDFGIANPIKDVVHDNVIVLNEPRLVDFLQRHYYDSVAVDTLASFGYMTFYKYRLVLPNETLSKEDEQ
jgi:hypothetical protein